MGRVLLDFRLFFEVRRKIGERVDLRMQRPKRRDRKDGVDD
jgi:hypothetical protein